MPLSIKDLMPSDLEFQMFVLDELADELSKQGADVLKLTIGVTELPMPPNVLERMIEDAEARALIVETPHDRTVLPITDRMSTIREGAFFSLITAYPD